MTAGSLAVTDTQSVIRRFEASVNSRELSLDLVEDFISQAREAGIAGKSRFYLDTLPGGSSRILLIDPTGPRAA